MPRTIGSLIDAKNFKEVLARLGNIPPERIRWHPYPGTATECDLLRINGREDVLCELIDGVLVEKPVGAQEGYLASELIQALGPFAKSHDLGAVFAPDTPLRVFAGLVRLPDVCFVSWERLPGKMVPAEPIPNLIPELTVEVLSPSNTTSEMLRKRKEFFLAGTQLFWIVDPNKRTVNVYTAPDDFETLGESDTLTGGDVLPGFTLKLADLFARVPKPPAKAPKKRQKP